MGEILPLTTTIVCFGLALLLAVAGATKLSQPASAAQSMAQYGLVSKRYAPAVSIVLSVVELSVAIGLLLPPTVVPASVGAALLFALFTGAVGLVLVRKKTVDCGCFGEAWKTRVSRRTLARNSTFFLTALLLVSSHRASFQPPFESMTMLHAVVTLGSLLCMAVGWGITVWGQQARPPSTILPVADRSSDPAIRRRTVLKFATFLGISPFVSVDPELQAAPCCYARVVDHFDPRCCRSSVFAIHHHYKHCYNRCTGRLGVWTPTRSDTCDTYDCACGCAQDVYHPYQASCYRAWECSCCTNCPC